MKKRSLLTLISAAFLFQFSNAQTVQSITTAGGTLGDFARVIARDANGNIAVAGNGGSSFTWGTFPITNAGMNDIIVAEYNSSGTVAWAKEIGGTGMDAANSIAMDGNGNVFISGSFQNNFSWGTNNMVSAGSDDLFFAKYDPSGNLLYVKQYGGTGSDRASAITVDNTGNVIITGFFSANFTFGTTPLTTNGGQDIFTAKFDNSGNLQWVTTAGGTGTESGRVITADATGNIYVGGSYTANFTYGTSSLTAAGMNDICLAKYDGTNGAVLWANGTGGTLVDQPMSICKDPSGNIFLSGYFQSNFTYGTTALTNAGLEDIFLAQYNPANGNIIYVKQQGGTGSDEGLDIHTDAIGNIWMTGFISNSFTFGTTLLTSAGNNDELLAKFDNSGNVISALTHGGTGLDRGRGITLDANNNIYIVGEFQSNFNYGTFPITSAGTDDIYLSVHCTQPPPAPVITLNVNTLSTTALGSYQWYLNGNPIGGATNQQYTATSTGNYTVIVSNACGNSPASNIIYVGFSGIANANINFDFSIFPNPSSGIFNVNYTGIAIPEAQVLVYDLVGNIIFKQNINLQNGANNLNIDFKDAAPGIYFTALRTNEGVATHKIIVEK